MTIGITEIILSDYLNLPLSSEMLTSAMDSMLGEHQLSIVTSHNNI